MTIPNTYRWRWNLRINVYTYLSIAFHFRECPFLFLDLVSLFPIFADAFCVNWHFYYYNKTLDNCESLKKIYWLYSLFADMILEIPNSLWTGKNVLCFFLREISLPPNLSLPNYHLHSDGDGTVTGVHVVKKHKKHGLSSKSEVFLSLRLQYFYITPSA